MAFLYILGRIIQVIFPIFFHLQQRCQPYAAPGRPRPTGPPLWQGVLSQSHQDLQAGLQRSVVVGGGGAAGEDGDIFLLGVGHQVGVEAGCDNELPAGSDGGVGVLLCILPVRQRCHRQDTF